MTLHGKNGLVMTRFRKGVPGQAFGSLVEISRLNQSTLSSVSVALTF